VPDSKYGRPTQRGEFLKMDGKKKELQGFTIDRIKELCGEKHIKIYGKTKDALIEQLLGAEVPEKAGGATADEGKLPTPTHLMEMVMRMQQDQRAWLEAQQKRQEEIMEMNQRAQKELLDAVLTASRASEESAPLVAPGSSGGRIKPLRPTLQKLSKEDDIESYLDMFERVAGQQGWPKETWATQLAGLLSGEALDIFTSVPMESGTPPGPSAVLQPQVKEEVEGSFKLPPKGNLQTCHCIPGKKGGGQGSPLRSKTNHKGASPVKNGGISLPSAAIRNPLV
jgi:hypothetical protein